MYGLILAALAATPEPRPYPDTVPAVTFTRPTEAGGPRTWNTRSKRVTKYWRGVGGLLFCDDPSCTWCGPHVYPALHDDRPVVPIKR